MNEEAKDRKHFRFPSRIFFCAYRSTPLIIIARNETALEKGSLLHPSNRSVNFRIHPRGGCYVPRDSAPTTFQRDQRVSVSSFRSQTPTKRYSIVERILCRSLRFTCGWDYGVGSG